VDRVLIRISILLVTVLPAWAQERSSCDLSAPHTLYSQHASIVQHRDIKSPDGRKVLTVTPVVGSAGDIGLLRFTVNSDGKNFSSDLAGLDAEISWAPDSSAFAVTQSEGVGGVGIRVYIFYTGTEGLRKLAISPTVEKAFGTPVKCEVPTLPNTGFVTWLRGSQLILVAAEVVPVSVCECGGWFRLYELHVPDLRIVNAYDQEVAKEKFADVLGCELLDAEKCEASRR
jgi:hypothetical protein